MDHWDKRFLDLAKHVATWSKDPSTKVGAVIAKGNHVLALGFNGFPKSIEDDHRLCDRQTKMCYMVHAEQNAILHCPAGCEGATLYTWPLQSCPECAKLAIQSGIKRHVSIWSEREDWKKLFRLARCMFYEAGVEVMLYEAE